MPHDETKPSLLDAQTVRHLLTAGGLVAGTLGTLLLGAALQVDPQTVASGGPSVITGTTLSDGTLRSGGAPPVAGGSLTAPEPAPEPPAPVVEPAPLLAPTGSAPVSLFDRDDDPRRLLNAGNEWTLQFMVTCNDESATRLLRELDSDERLYLLPISLNDQSCFRICWNTFRSRDRALASRDIPEALRKINAEPIARKVADITP